MEQDGIVFIDEIDKIVVNQDLRYGISMFFTTSPVFVCFGLQLIHSMALLALSGHCYSIHLDASSDSALPSVTGADASSEGVQRDLLPIIEGSQVSTKYGNVSTDYILFICSGAFHQCKPSDMLAELQGRLPIRVELKGLTCAAPCNCPDCRLAS